MGRSKYKPTAHESGVFQESQHIVEGDSPTGRTIFGVEVAKYEYYSKNNIVEKLSTSERNKIVYLFQSKLIFFKCFFVLCFRK